MYVWLSVCMYVRIYELLLMCEGTKYFVEKVLDGINGKFVGLVRMSECQLLMKKKIYPLLK